MMLSKIDPLKWLDDLLCMSANGQGTYIEWIGPTGDAIEMMLRAHGIRVWSRSYDYDREQCYGVHVRPAQAKFAAGLIAGHGGVVVVGPPSPPIRPRTTWGAPAPAQGLAGIIVGLFGQPFGGTRRRGGNRGR